MFLCCDLSDVLGHCSCSSVLYEVFASSGIISVIDFHVYLLFWLSSMLFVTTHTIKIVQTYFL